MTETIDSLSAKCESADPFLERVLDTLVSLIAGTEQVEDRLVQAQLYILNYGRGVT